MSGRRHECLSHQAVQNDGASSDAHPRRRRKNLDEGGAKAERILATLRAELGDGGFHYIIPPGLDEDEAEIQELIAAFRCIHTSRRMATFWKCRLN